MKKKYFFCLISIISNFLFFALSRAEENNSFYEDSKRNMSICHNLENRVVNAYLTNSSVAYKEEIGLEGLSIIHKSSSNGSDLFYYREKPYLSYVDSKMDGTASWTEQPDCVRLYTPMGDIVRVSTVPEFSSYNVFNVTKDTTYIYNLIPQTVYYYQILSIDNKTLSTGVFKTTGKLRMARVDHILNLRDIGGWPCDGGHLAYGKIFRGAADDDEVWPLQYTPSSESIIMKTHLGVNAELDLRGNEHNGRSPLGEDVDYVGISIKAYTEQMTGYYQEFGKCIKQLVTNLEAGKCTYVHCSWGADRTGTFIAIIEALCGVSTADVVKDWEITSFNAVDYHKYIDREQKEETDEMRPTLRYLYNNYGGNNGHNLKDQVVAWCKDKVFSHEPDKGSSIIERLRYCLIEKDKRSPIIVHGGLSETESMYYTVTDQETNIYDLEECIYINGTTAERSIGDALSLTNFINCQDFAFISMNVLHNHVLSFYDSKYNYISSIVEGDPSKEAILFKNCKYRVPSNAVYVRFNVPKFSDWTAVLTAE